MNANASYRSLTVGIAAIVSLAMVFALCATMPHTAQAAPAKVKIASVKSKASGCLSIKVKKAKGAKGYEYKIGTNKSVSANAQTYKTKAKGVTFKGLDSGKKYFAKVRAFSGSSYGKWSSAKSATIKGVKKTISGVTVDSPYSKFSDSAAASLKEDVKVDFSNAVYGYVGVKGSKGSGKYKGNKLKVQVKKGSETYNHDLSTDGSACFYPLNMGDGSYKVSVLRNTSGTSYYSLGSVSFSAQMMNAYQPFMHNNWYTDYSPSSSSVSKAKSLCSSIKSDTDRVSAIYKYLTKTIKYDYNKAKNVKSGYTPNPDSTLKSKKGICYDYASLAAAMMRSQGIPCRIITGYVAPNDVYHAWNMIYLKNQGWITSEIKAQNNQWGRIDVTFAATGANSKFIGNGKNYSSPRYIY